LRPGNRLTAIAAPSGSPTSVAITTAARLTRRLRRTISDSFGSSCPIIFSASRKASWRVSMSAVRE
jgi:hypothetical protein